MAMRQRSARGGHVSRRVDQCVHGRKHQVPKNDGENVQTDCHCTARGVGIVESATGIHETTAGRRGRTPAGKVLFVGAKRLPNAARAPTCHGGVSTAMVLFGGLWYRCLLVRPVCFVVLAWLPLRMLLSHPHLFSLLLFPRCWLHHRGITL